MAQTETILKSEAKRVYPFGLFNKNEKSVLGAILTSNSTYHEPMKILTFSLLLLLLCIHFIYIFAYTKSIYQFVYVYTYIFFFV